jgi:hypothetical protein
MDWKINWTVTFAEMHDINQMTTNDRAFANHSGAEAKQTSMMAKSLDNLANAAIHKNKTLEKPVIVKEKL